MSTSAEIGAHRSVVVNVVSGKGGTGKSLLTAILGRALAVEGLSVLLIDFDIFVRGLTILLARSATGSRMSEGRTISDILGTTGGPNRYPSSPDNFLKDSVQRKVFGGYAITRFLECDVLPAVTDLAAPLDYNEPQLSSYDDMRATIADMLGDLRKNYDIILVDNRAGIDSVVLATSRESDVVLSVAEDDEVSLQSNSTLINHMRYREDIRHVYTLINKARRINSYEDLKTARYQRVEFSYIGLVPFDTEVLQDYGSERFWQTVYQTLYFRAVIDAWNELASQRGKLPRIESSRYVFPPRILMTPRLSKFALIERVLLVYGLVILLASFGFYIFRRWETYDLKPDDLIGLGGGLMGFVLILLPILGIRRILVGTVPDESDEDGNRLTNRRSKMASK